MGGFLMHGQVELIEYEDGSYDEYTYAVKSIRRFDKDGNLKEKMYIVCSEKIKKQKKSAVNHEKYKQRQKLV